MGRLYRHHEQLIAEAETLGCTAISLLKTKNHTRFHANATTGQPVLLFVSSTPSDWRSERNNISLLRRKIRELT